MDRNIIESAVFFEKQNVKGIDILLMIVILYFSSGFNGGIPPVFTLGAVFFLSVFFFFRNIKDSISLSSKGFLYTIILIISLGVSLIAKPSGINQTILSLGTVITGLILAYSFNFYKFTKTYILAMRIIVSFSLLTFIIAIISPSVISVAPKLVNSAGTSGHVVGVSIVVLSSNLRNYGIFWEPGAFQMYLALAVLFELHLYNLKNKWKFIFLYSAAIVTTFSTTGFFVLLMLILNMIAYSEKLNKRMIILVVLVLIATLLLFLYKDQIPYIQYAFFDKPKEVLNLSTVHGTVRVRQESVVIPFQILNSPLFGVGAGGLKEDYQRITGHTMATFTPINWFARHGIIFGLLMVFGLWKLTKLINTNLFQRLMIFMIIIISVSTEEFRGIHPFLFSLLWA